MATYKTPGGYVEEISKLPPSVAQVETAIPAFIGYTQKAQELSAGDLSNKPVRIGSMLDYESLFGFGPEPNVTEVNVDSNNNFLSAKVENKFFLYDSLRLFFANGGGDCFIVSVGSYGEDPMQDTDFTRGLSALEKEDVPTMLLFPDAAGLEENALANVQTAALKQCEYLQDRVALLDLRKNDPLGVSFRGKVGINFLSYGAAYTPWLRVAMPKKVKFPDVKTIKRAGTTVSVKGLTADDEIKDKISAVENAYADKEAIKNKTNDLTTPDRSLSGKFASLEGSFNASPDNNNLQAIFQFLYNIGKKIDEFIHDTNPALTSEELKGDIGDAVASNFDPALANVVSLDKEVDKAIDTYSAISDKSGLPDMRWPVTNEAIDIDPAAHSPNPALIIDGAEDADVRREAVSYLRTYFDEINASYYALIINAAAAYVKTTEEALEMAFPVYKAILTGIRKSMTAIPPSGAVAGVYAMVDRTRGVWKSPANVSLSNVIAPEVAFTKSQLDNLNVDPVAGKSINAIRTFSGKGTLVFGARTLAGNDNEWRYVSVRRLFNMVEESTKKASEMFVFEPNDANTWVRVQGMLENYLTTLWRQGALQGAKPEHAFYVAVGLGKTMTSLDILEGRMIVEIGMAAVRPAEFIILRFSHKLAES